MAFSIYDQTWQYAKQKAIDPAFEIVETGWEQHVLIDHVTGIVYRYPRTVAAAQKLDDEVQVLRELNLIKWPVQIPYLTAHTAEYNIYNYIDGDVLDKALLAMLNPSELQEIGEKLGEFLAILHAQNEKIIQNKKTKQTTSLYEYYRSRIMESVASEYTNQALNDLRDIDEPDGNSQVVVHGDLHGLNMVIDRNTRHLIGVIDFSELEIGDPHQDFRKIFMTQPDLLEPALRNYEFHGGPVLSPQTVRLWAYVNEWANVCYFHDQPENLTFQRALNHLQLWGRLT